MIAKTAASGGASLLPEVLAFSSSLELDRGLIREDLIGSLAHVVMLSRTRIIPNDAARLLHRGLVDLWTAAQCGSIALDPEEDVHMAIEAALKRSIGEAADRLHTARSRNDQVALTLHLHVREQCAHTIDALAALVAYLADRAAKETEILLPSYTHRQRAQPISASYWWLGYGAMFVRDIEAFQFVLSQADVMPLGVGAIAGTSLPIDRTLVQSLLRFGRLTSNGLDTVGDRDFVIDYAYAAARLLLHASRLATDVIDFSSAEFGFVQLDGEIACGSSMMPQKKNPDVFELVRGKSGAAVGNLVNLLVTLKGLPGGYNRDLQQDRAPLLATDVLLESVLSILRLVLPRVRFNQQRCLDALHSDATQATDLAEALVKQGLPFREAYQMVGALVRRCQELGIALAQTTAEVAQQVDARLSSDVLDALRIEGSIARKVSVGSTGPESVASQIHGLKEVCAHVRHATAQVPKLETLFEALQSVSL